MGVYIVAYDLEEPGQDYQALYDYLGRFPNCHEQGSVWFIESDQTARAIRDELKGKLDSNDQLFVGQLRKGNWAGRQMKCGKWLKSQSRQW